MNNIVKTVIGFILAALIGAGGYISHDLTSDQAIAIATSPEKAADACKDLLNGNGYVTVTPPGPVPVGAPVDVIPPAE